MDLRSLPQEILPNIFEFLPLQYRKNVRLTCRQWKFHCDHPKIIAREKFVFRPGYCENNMALIKTTIMNCEVIRSDFEFHMVELEEFNLYWEHCGSQIKSIFIYECSITEEMFTNIIIHCSNLVSFHIHSSRSVLMLCQPEWFRNRITFVKRTNLLSLKLFANGYVDMNNLFQVFPNIRTLGLGFTKKQHSFPYVVNIRHIVRRLMQPPSPWSGFPPTLENLVYKTSLTLTDAVLAPLLSLLSDSENSRENLIRFRELEVDLIISANIDCVHKFFVHQNKLRKLRLRIKGGVMTTARTLLFLIMRSSPELEELEFRSEHAIQFTVIEFSDFLNEIKRLESLKLSFKKFLLKKQTHLADSPRFPSIEYFRLKTFLLKCETMSADFSQITLEILNRCRSLQVLGLKCATDDVWQEIVQNQTELRTLQIYLDKKDENSVGCSSSQKLNFFDRLRRLEHLNIYGDMDEIFALEFDFPNLKYFQCSCPTTEDTYRLLEILSLRAPSLEILRIETKFLYSLHSIEYFRRLKYLRFIIFNRFHSEGNPLNQLFMNCPSLTYVADNRRIFYLDNFSKDIDWYNSDFESKSPIYHKHNMDKIFSFV